MAHRDLQAGLGGQGGQLGFPRPGTVTVGATRIRCDQQPVGLWIVGAAAGLPPAADRGDCERGGVVVAPDVDPAGVRGHVVDAVRDRLAGLPVEEVVRVDPDRFTLRAPLPAVVLVRADQFLLFGIHADNRVSAGLVLLDLLVEVTKLRVPVRVLLALQGLGVGLQAEALRPQQASHRIRRDRPSLRAHLVGELAGGLGRPPQRRHRITPHVRLDQSQQRQPQTRIQIDQPLAAATLPACTAQRGLTGLQFGHAPRHRALGHPRGPGQLSDPAVTQRPRFRAQQQATLPLIQVRQQRLQLRRQTLIGSIHRPISHDGPPMRKPTT
jgi:hypothetical protein